MNQERDRSMPGDSSDTGEPPAVDITGQSSALGRVQPDQSLASWLASHPDAMVSALGPNGAPLQMPTSIPLGLGHQVDTRSSFELVIPEDSRRVADTFVAALAHGVGVARIHMSNDPETRAPPPLSRPASRTRDHPACGDLWRGLRRRWPRIWSGQPNGSNRRSHGSGTMIKNETAAIISVDRATTLMLGWAASDLVGRSTLEFVHPDDQVRAIDNWMSRLTGRHGYTVQSARLRYLCKDGTWLWLETSNDFRGARRWHHRRRGPATGCVRGDGGGRGVAPERAVSPSVD